MLEKEIEKFFENQELIETLYDSQNIELYISDKEPVYTLNECLTSLNTKALKNIYTVIEYFSGKDFGNKKNDKEKIKKY